MRWGLRKPKAFEEAPLRGVVCLAESAGNFPFTCVISQGCFCCSGVPAEMGSSCLHKVISRLQYALSTQIVQCVSTDAQSLGKLSASKPNGARKGIGLQSGKSCKVYLTVNHFPLPTNQTQDWRVWRSALARAGALPLGCGFRLPGCVVQI